MKRKLLTVLLTLIAVLCLCICLVACDLGGNTADTDPNDTGTEQGDTQTPSTKEYTVTYDANGGEFAGGGSTSTQTVKAGAKLTAPVSPTRKNYTFAGWTTSKNGSEMWKFDEDTVSSGITLWAKWAQESTVILSVDGASIDGREIFMLVDPTTDDLSLSNMVVCSDDSIWRLYSDPEGQREIPTKMLTNLKNGDNKYYIVVNSQNQAQVNVYTLTVHRSYLVAVSYYNGESLLETAEIYTGNEFTASYTPDITGYTFNGWKKGGSAFTSEVIWAPLSLYADKTANRYKVTLDVNHGDTLSETEKTLTYDKSYSLPVPERTGYSFTGWYAEDTQLTNEKGNSLSAWNYASEKQLKAHWEANNYVVTLNQNDKNAGTVSGGGEHAYDSKVTITAKTIDGYNFLGWYDKNDELVSENAQYTFKMGLAVTYTAKWDYYTLTTTCNDIYAGTLTGYYSEEKVSVGTEVTFSAITNKGYTWVGWYKDGEEISQDFTYQYTMTKENVTFEARWSKVTLSVNDSDAGSIKQLIDTYKVGDEVTLAATSNIGYTWLGWYKGDDEVSEDLIYPYTMTKENVSLEARWALDPAMEDFKFDSTPTTCIIMGVNDITKTEYIIPDYVTSIRADSFNGCRYVQSMTIPFVGGSRKSAKDTYQFPFGFIFGTSGFWGSSAVESSYYGNSTSILTRSTFYIPDSLKKVTVTGGEILYGAFENCSGLQSVTIGSGVTSIGKEAFYHCTGLESVTIGNGVTSIGEEAFRDCTGLESVTIGSGVTSIGEMAFYGCSGLRRVTIGSGVTSIGEEAFVACEGLSGVYITDLTAWCKIEFCGERSNPLSFADHLYVDNVEVKDLTIPSEITEIKPYAFYDCGGLTSITIPDSVVASIGDRAFEACIELKSLMIGNGVTSIGEMAFFYCTGLESVTIGSGVTSIGDDAFEYCSELTSIIIPDSVASIGGGAFSSCWSLESIEISNGVTSIGRSAFSSCSSLTSIVIPDSVTSIGDMAFRDCTGLESVIIGSGVTSIGEMAFYGCSGLRRVTIGSGVTSIGDSAFGRCSSLTSVYYMGTADEWWRITIDEINTGNSMLISATRYYYSAEENYDGEHWHYDPETGKPVVWTKENG